MMIYFFLLSLIGLVFSLSTCVIGQKYCKKCTVLTNICLRCEFEVFIPDKEGGCIPAKKCELGKNYCEECDEENEICSECAAGYYPDENGGCSYTENCEISFSGKCLICKSGFALIGNDIKICKSLELDDLKNCRIISYSNGSCQICQDGYFLNEGDKKCIKTENCYLSSYGKCLSCIQHFYLDHNDDRKCKYQLNKERLMHCKETEDGENCSNCEEGYYFDDDNKCIFTKHCSKSNGITCEQCMSNYFLAKDGSCVNIENCNDGEGESSECKSCVSGFYFDANDGQCYSNQNDDDLKFCTYFTDKCTLCESNYELGEDGKCVNTLNCAKSTFGVCFNCKDNYYLGIDKKCSPIEHCIYSTYFYSCDECEGGFYFNQKNETCEEEEGDLKNCKKTEIFSNSLCGECKTGYYLSIKQKRNCISNEEEGPFYKCAKTQNYGTECARCEKNYYMGSKDKKCSKIPFCSVSEKDRCIECNEDYCLNVKTGTCEYNNYVEEEDSKFYYKCNRTNKEGTACEECVENYIMGDNGFCTNPNDCAKEEDGVCVKCNKLNDNFYSFCLNSNFGCVEKYMDENCLRCDDDLNFDNCTECKNGFKLVENKVYLGEFVCVPNEEE